MIGASVAFATIMLFWAQSFTSASGTGFSSNIDEDNARASEQFNIDEVKIGSETTKVYIRNFGDNPVRIVAIYLQNTTSGEDLSIDSELNPAQIVLARSVSMVSVQFESSAMSGQMVTIQVASDRGNTYRKSFSVD